MWQGGDGVDFVAVVDQAIALLRQRGRLTYRTLQRQFPHSIAFSGNALSPSQLS